MSVGRGLAVEVDRKGPDLCRETLFHGAEAGVGGEYVEVAQFGTALRGLGPAQEHVVETVEPPQRGERSFAERAEDAGAALAPRFGDAEGEEARSAAAAGARCPETFAEIEAVLRAHGGMPPRDTIGIYSGGNRFLQARYAIHAGVADTAGLGVFVVRDLGIPIDLVELRAAIEAAGFTVVAERPIAPGERAVIDSIRGGNWSDVTVAGRPTPPIHCLVCFDPKPIRPGRRARRKYPRLDNERMLVKEAIRLRLGARLGTGRANFLHGSDNAAEALDYVEQLGLAADPRIAPLIARAGGAEGSRGGAQHG